MAFSPDGTKFLIGPGEGVWAAGGETDFRLWRTVDQKPLGQPIPSYGKAAFSPDGKLVVLQGTDSKLRF